VFLSSAAGASFEDLIKSIRLSPPSKYQSSYNSSLFRFLYGNRKPTELCGRVPEWDVLEDLFLAKCNVMKRGWHAFHHHFQFPFIYLKLLDRASKLNPRV
jgi:hypothetical protein